VTKVMVFKKTAAKVTKKSDQSHGKK